MKIVEKFSGLLECNSRFLVLKGSAGSGKSHFIAQKLLLDVMSSGSEKVLVLRKIKDTVKNSCYDLVESVARGLAEEDGLSVNKVFTFTKSPMEIRYIAGSKFIFGGLDDPEKVKSITDITRVWIEEATEFTQNDLEQLNLRLRTTKGKLQFIISFNPIDENHWLKSLFFDSYDKDGNYRTDEIFSNSTIHESTYLDNPFLDKGYCLQLSSLKSRNENLYRIYALGEWGSVSKSKILSNWEVQPCDKRLGVYRNLACGQDYGYNHASVQLLCGEKGDSLYVLREVYVKQHTNREFMVACEEKILGPVREDIGRELVIYSESAEPDRNQEFRQAGHNIIEVEKRGSFVKDCINVLQSYNKIYIDPSCVNTIKEIGSWEYKTDKEGRVYDTPVEVFDDCMAGLRYYAISTRSSRSYPVMAKTIDWKRGLAGKRGGRL